MRGLLQAALLFAALLPLTLAVARGQTAAPPVAEVVVTAPEPRYVAPTLRDRIGRIWAPVFIDGQKAMTLRGERIAEEFHVIVEDYIERRFGQRVAA